MILRVANENVGVAWIWKKKKKKIFSCGHVSLEIIVYSERSVNQCFTGQVSQITIIIRGKSSMPVTFLCENLCGFFYRITKQAIDSQSS